VVKVQENKIMLLLYMYEMKCSPPTDVIMLKVANGFKRYNKGNKKKRKKKSFSRPQVYYMTAPCYKVFNCWLSFFLFFLNILILEFFNLEILYCTPGKKLINFPN